MNESVLYRIGYEYVSEMTALKCFDIFTKTKSRSILSLWHSEIHSYFVIL